MKFHCVTCGVLSASRIIDQRRRDGLTFYCPNGHAQNYSPAIENDKLTAIAKEKKDKEDAIAAQLKLEEEARQKEIDRIASLSLIGSIKEAIVNFED